MIEVNLFTIPAGDQFAKAGRCVARNRFNKDAMGVTIEAFVKGFLKDNLDKINGGVSSELSAIINNEGFLSRKDLACINFYLAKSGYMFKVFNVADDEDNATGIPGGESVVEWNIIDRNFVQFDYPTCTKVIPGPDQSIIDVLKKITVESSLFASEKFTGLKNPFTSLIVNLERIKNVSGSINPTLVSRVYEILDQVGIDVFVATSED